MRLISFIMEQLAKHFVLVARPLGGLQRSKLPALAVGPYLLEGFFDRSGQYFERVTYLGRYFWFILAQVETLTQEAA